MEYEPFWISSKRGLLLRPYHYKKFLEYKGIFKLYPSKNEGFTFIIKEGFFVDVISLERIKDIVLTELQTIGEEEAWSLMASHVNYFSKDFLAMLQAANINIIKDSRHNAFIYYQNTAVKVTSSNFELIPYKDIGGLVWKEQVINRNIKLSPESNGIFKSFIWKISGETPDKYFTLKSVIGHLLHSYKNKSKNRAIIFNDEMISDEPNGGSGKGLFHKAIGHIKKVSTIDGKMYDPQKSFIFQTVSPDCQVLLFDDVKRAFNFESLFSIITEELHIEKKGLHPVVLSFEDSPKISITTNYTIQGDGGSFNRRVFEIELSSYFNDSYTPEDEFKQLLFDDWTPEEWANFDNYMLRSVQFFLQKGLYVSENKNLKLRKLIDGTSKQFVEFMEDRTFDGELYYGTELRELFEAAYNDYYKYKWFNSRLFNRWLEKYCRFANLELTYGKTSGARWIMIKPMDGQMIIAGLDKVEELPMPF